MIERLSARLSSETIQQRIERLQQQWTETPPTSPSRSVRPARKKPSSSVR
jgi:hypothetical protein